MAMRVLKLGREWADEALAWGGVAVSEAREVWSTLATRTPDRSAAVHGACAAANIPLPPITRRVIPLALVLLMAAACGKSAPLNPRPHPCVFDSDCAPGLVCLNAECVSPDALDGGRQRGSKQFGEPCDTGDECQSGYCLGGPRGSFCSAGCDQTTACPNGFSCKVVPDPTVEVDPDGGFAPQITLCALPQPLLCQPCEKDTDCGASGGDHCLPSGIYGFCGQDCTFDACPQGYTCNDNPRGRQCEPVGETCDCKPDTVGRFRGCANEGDAGVCYGAQVCTADAGWGECTARAAMVEDCNGFDDDCNGLADDNLAPRECTRTSPFGTCKGPQTCQGAAGWRCDAPTAAAETCNYVDDDCDGIADQTFVDTQGRYVSPEHCGGCGNSCSALIEHSSQTSCELDTQGAPECRVQKCQNGFFPSPDGRQCLKLSDSLCRSCTEDSDCVGPNSKCLELNGEKVCGRDCSASSAFPACPGGYACNEVSPGVKQCLPTNGTCQCNAAQLGNTRSCEVVTPLKTCSGYETCAASSSGPAWSTCDVASFNPEICDGLDNNCNGQVDEGFKNPVSGKYQALQHCGFCNNDCSKYWSPTLQHTSGVCDTTLATPICKMGACTSEVVGGTTYEWRDVNGDTQDGCECRRVQGNTTLDQPQEVAPFVDENCDGVDGVIADALFVWSGASNNGNGSLSRPFRTIGQAISALPSTGKKYVLVAEGTYNENVVVTGGVRLYGGYSRDFKVRDPVLYASIIQGQVPSSSALPPAAVYVKTVGASAPSTVVAAFTIHGVDQLSATPDDQEGAPSYAVLLEDTSASVRIVNNDLLAGQGGKGGRGSTGTQGFGRQSSVTLDGHNGISSSRLPAPCPTGQSRAGGSSGHNSQCTSANGNPGGGVVCPVFNWITTSGNHAPYPANSGLNGEGGHDWSYDFQSLFSCSHVTESGFPNNIQTHDGRDGEAGSDGNSGTGGQGAPTRASLGSVVGNRWSPSPFTASNGSIGGHAQGGGGGGAGGGTAFRPGGQCSDFEWGSTGGGGGAGGCGGSGGRAGRSGGAAITIFLTYSSTPAAGQLPVISGNRIERNLGGDGGNGGFGGAGGQGGAGGFGGSPTNWSASTGGKGGDGGNGGAGGGGGGGAGGPSFGILGFRANPAGYLAQNTFLTSSSASTGGKGGAGGSSSGSAATGTDGADGASANLQAILPCAAGCTGGTVCDANGVCSAP